MPFPFIAAAIAAAVVSTVAGAVATEEQIKTAKKENRIRQRVASVERNRNVRLAIAQRRQQEAEILQGSETQGTRSNSAVSGAVGSLRSSTASSIGFSNTSFAGDVFANKTRLRGIRRAGTFGTISNVAGTASSIFAAGASTKTPGGGTTPNSKFGPFADGYRFGP